MEVADGLASIGGRYTAVFRWNNAGQRWDTFAPQLPSALQGFSQLERGRAYWIAMTESGTLVPGRPESAPVPSERTQTFSGRGDQVIPVNLSAGVTLIDAVHRGTSNFVIFLRGASDDLLVNEIGSYRGTSAVGVGGGGFLIDISADGAWEIDVREPRNQRPTSTRAFNGRGPGVTGFLALDGLHTVSATHSGRSNFVIWVFDESGNKVDLVVNEVGRYDGSNAVRLRDGLYFLAIEADGVWTIGVR